MEEFTRKIAQASHGVVSILAQQCLDNGNVETFIDYLGQQACIDAPDGVRHILGDDLYNEIVVLYSKIHEIYEKEYKGEGCEGYVIRMADEFTYGQFRMSLMKYVDPLFREKINNSHGHWISQKITPNKLS